MRSFWLRLRIKCSIRKWRGVRRVSEAKKRNCGRFHETNGKICVEKQTTEKRTTGGVAVVFSVCTIVGAVAGAGFLSGRELLEFYGGFRVFPLAVSFAAFALGFLLFLRLGANFGGFDGVMRGLFSGDTAQSGGSAGAAWAARAAKGAALFCSFSVGAATLSALHAAYPQGRPFFAVAFVAIALLCTRRGISGLSSFGAVFTPFLIAAVLALIAIRGCFSLPENTDFLCGARASCAGIVYACMNVFAVSPVLCDLGKTLKNKKKTAVAAFGAAGALTLLSAAILSAMSGDKCSYSKPLPLDYVLNGGKFFALLSAIGMLTTFTACFYPAAEAAKSVALRAGNGCAGNAGAGRGTAAKIAAGAAFLIASLLPFEKIVRYFYPIAGVLGAAVIAAAAISAFGLCRRRAIIPR